MNINNLDDDIKTSSTLDEVNSPRKKLRLDNSARKTWSLMNIKTDQEVLQEMGVSLLEQDEAENTCEITHVTHKPNLKRKHDIENVNPNINSISPRRFSPKSPKVKKPCASPGPSKAKSPWSPDKTKQDLETTLISNYLIEEETPLAQITQYQPQDSEFVANTSTGKKSFTSLGMEEVINRRTKSEPTGIDTFSILSDEMILSVFKWLPKRTLAHCMLVCKRWYRLACDESLWQRLDLGNKVLSKDALGRVLARKPIIIRLASTEIGEWHPTTAVTQSRIQYLDLSMCSVDQKTLDSLLERCTSLRKLSLESVQINDSTCTIIGKCKNLETLNLTMAKGITAEGLEEILKGCVSLLSLNISWCNLNQEALQVLVTCLPQKLQRLNVGGARIMTNDMVQQLVERCPRLLELDLSDCSVLSAIAVKSVLNLSCLEHVALSRCYLLPPHVLTKLGSMSSLQYLEVWGMLQAGSLTALRAALPGMQINQFMFSAIARPTVGARRTSIWGLRTRD
ncbi:PREDICTED: S-phase kinase-associated protein 2-like [Papilio polytes]|uniref:S-phase kinase-associated protein 2-like n=1 Tax=Papilio polytes TaxID=76194 RepID=UPI000675CAC5|nr:PREDICTED: S-phase kinase-associated protein 2-like [Papilio polytes]